jgi:1-acyl-sn-glycerol-3-phosphate acyltransferase
LIRKLFLRLFFYLQALVVFTPGWFLWRLRVRGAKFHRGSGGLIIAANHQSWLDAPLVQYAVFPHQITFLMTEDYYDLPIAGLYFRASGTQPVREGGRPSVAAMRAAYSALERGKIICLFPEGEISPDGLIGAGKRGVAHIARKTGVPVLPIGIRGAVEVYSKKQPKFKLRGRVSLHIGEPMKMSGSGRDAEDAFTQELMNRLRDLAGEGAHVALPSETTPNPADKDEARSGDE